MEQKNKFDTFDKPDDFDKMLFDYYDNNNEEVPLSTQNAIENAFKDKPKEKSTTIILLIYPLYRNRYSNNCLCKRYN